MILFKSILWLFLICGPSTNIFGQIITNYIAYQTKFAYVTTCPTNQYYDIALLQCSRCPTDSVQKLS
ncbi:unnamed protein product, partial [Rotaria sp. Silwood1]